MEKLGYIDLGGGMQVVYWRNIHTNSWNMFSTLTEEAYESYEEFNTDIFFSDSKLNLWISKATKVDYKKLVSTYNELIKADKIYFSLGERKESIMKSAEISKKIGALEIEKARLEKELTETIKKEEEERKKSLCDNSKAFILKLWELHWKDEDNSESQRRLDGIKEQYRLNMWITEDVKAALKKTKLKELENIRQLISEYGVDCDFERCIVDAKIRLDFASALRNTKRGYELSGKLGWGFAPDDLMELMKLHKSNKFRNKIEDLLTDCNFHSESALLSEKKYDKFEKHVMEDCQ